MKISRDEMQERMAALAQLATLAREAALSDDFPDDVAADCVSYFLSRCAEVRRLLTE
jgi:hypothetical protein